MALEKFHYDSPHGKITATKFKDLPIGFVSKIRRTKADDMADIMFEMVEHALDAKSLAVFDKLSSEEFGAFQQAWTEDSGVGVGESSASSES